MKILLAVACLIMCSCTYSVHLVNFSDQIPQAKSGTPVHARSEQFVVLGFVADTNYVNEAFARLQRQCKGTVTAITTKYYTDHGFFSWTNRIEMDGVCVSTAIN